MNIIRKEINSNLELPIWFIDKDTKKPEQELPSHLHDWHEIIFIHKGKGDFYIDSQFYPVMSGDIAIIPQNTVHFAIPDANQLITSSIIYFHPQLLKYMFGMKEPRFHELLNTQEHFIYTIPPEQTIVLEDILHEIKSELLNKLVDFETSILLLLQRFLLCVYRHSTPTNVHKKSSQIPWLKESIEYISNHFQTSLTLVGLAKKAAVSSAHYSRVFKSKMGVNVNEFIITKRISYIKKKLRESNETVESIAKQAGFSSMPYFYRTFKKYTGVTPDSFRSKQ
ncbi:helix-turn-helix transcriptional regulator [Lederbergia graminis]|uniref:AraC family transcriptional regulator n=1 Tax=Lederbergia graminis TaxID=735518 RepID=A0ABW0LFG5_9BACI